MIYFNSKYLSEKLNINLSRWKRWSREFLPPDPLGGLRSGYARQFTYRDAFIVYLGGRLVSRLNFSIPQAVQIVVDLTPWLKDRGYFSLSPQKEASGPNPTQIQILRRSDTGFGYVILACSVKEGIAKSARQGTGEVQQTLINLRKDDHRLLDADHGWVLFIEALYRSFLSRLEA